MNIEPLPYHLDGEYYFRRIATLPVCVFLDSGPDRNKFDARFDILSAMPSRRIHGQHFSDITKDINKALDAQLVDNKEK